MACRLILLSITGVGTVLVWAYILAQNWDVYAPGFRILSHNEEYVESETEFDLNPEARTADGSQMGTIEPVRPMLSTIFAHQRSFMVSIVTCIVSET